MSTRRTFLVALTLGLAVVPARARAAASKKTMRVGIVSFQERRSAWPEFDREMRERGWVEGQNIVFERRYFRGEPEPLPELMAELISLEVDVIVVTGAWAALAAQRATDRIPIVFYKVDAVADGIVANLARPEGNATGVSLATVQMQAKRLELLKQIAPGVSRVAALLITALGIPATLFEQPKPRGVEVFIVDLNGPEDLAPAMATVTKLRADGILVGAAWDWGDNSQFRAHIVEAVARQRLPAVFVGRGFVEQGGLLSLENHKLAAFHQLARYVDKILRGAKPADLPVELPTAQYLAINLKTAKALGLTIPRELLVRADRIVE